MNNILEILSNHYLTTNTWSRPELIQGTDGNIILSCKHHVKGALQQTVESVGIKELIDSFFLLIEQMAIYESKDKKGLFTCYTGKKKTEGSISNIVVFPNNGTESNYDVGVAASKNIIEAFSRASAQMQVQNMNSNNHIYVDITPEWIKGKVHVIKVIDANVLATGTEDCPDIEADNIDYLLDSIGQ
jgi:hypothetical protein